MCCMSVYLLWSFVVIQSLSCVRLLAAPWTAAHQASPSFTIAQNLLKLKATESVMPSNHLILCFPLLLLPSTFPSIRVFSNESALHIRCPLEGRKLLQYLRGFFVCFLSPLPTPKQIFAAPGAIVYTPPNDAVCSEEYPCLSAPSVLEVNALTALCLESESETVSCSVVSNSLQPHGP